MPRRRRGPSSSQRPASDIISLAADQVIVPACSINVTGIVPSSGSMRAQIGPLIIATSVIQLANGFFGTFISLRVATEDFGATLAGLVLSSYFAGFTLGAARLYAR